MDRREFLTRLVPGTTLPFLLSGFSLKAFGRSPLLEAMVASATETDRVLVLIQLSGGNDGLNTVIPLDQYSALAAARPNILIDESKVLPLTSVTGLHPGMAGMQSLFTAGKLAVVQSVGYPNPNFSHFRATDIWLTAADSNEVLPTGWLGRYLDQEFADFPQGYPNSVMPDPLAIQIGSIVSPSLQGPSVSMGMAVTNPNSTYILPGGSDIPPDTPAGHELTFVREVAEQTQQYSSAIKGAAVKGTNKSTLYPSAGTNSLADQLKIVAQLISGGLKTRIYVVGLGGFDTHASQVASTGGTDTGAHANLLGKLSAATMAFEDDLTLMGLDRRVVGMTFSEFGRRIKSNASLGTDHGTAAPLFVFGTSVNNGVIGPNPVLPAAATVNDNIVMTYDFRWVYASILQDWFGASATELQNVLASHTQTLPIISATAAGGGDGQARPDGYLLFQNYPNPFNPTTTIRYFLPTGAQVAIDLYDVQGNHVAGLVDDYEPAGDHELIVNAARLGSRGGGLASGTYFYRMRVGSFVDTKKLEYIK